MAARNLSTATEIGSLFNNCMNLLPIIAPDELITAASKVALFDMPKTDQARIPESHPVDAVEISLLLLVETLLRSGSGGARHHIDETACMFIDQVDAFFGGFRCDEHDHFEVIPFGDGFILFHIIGKRQGPECSYRPHLSVHISGRMLRSHIA